MMDFDAMTDSLSGKLLLKPYTAGMVTEDHVAWLNDPETVKYSEQRHHKHTLESQHEYLNRFPQGSRIWLIQDDDGAGVYDIGTISAYINVNNSVANMGILIGRRVWGKGYGRTAWRAVMDRLFDKGIRKIEAGCMRSNTRMINLAGACNMAQESCVPSHFMLNGKPEDMLVFGAINEHIL